MTREPRASGDEGPEAVDAYIAGFPPEVAERLRQVRAVVTEAAPVEARERICYRIPTLTAHGNVVHYAAFTDHVGLYPVPDDDPELAEALAPWRAGKGTLRFPLDRPLPLALVRRVVDRLVARDAERGAARKGAPRNTAP